MKARLPALTLISESWRGAGSALPSNAVWLGQFALLGGAYAAAVQTGAPWAASLALGILMFLAGVWLSLSVYRTLLGGRPGSLISLAHANLAVAAGFGFIAFFILFFVGAFGVMMLQLSGLVDLAAKQDAAALSAAQAALYQTPYGVALILVTASGAAALAYVALRLMVFAPATVTDGQARVFRTWGMTRGEVLPLALAALATHAAPCVAALVLARLIGPALPETGLGHLGRGVLSIILLAPFLLAGHGMAAAAYRRLKPEAAGLKAGTESG